MVETRNFLFLKVNQYSYTKMELFVKVDKKMEILHINHFNKTAF